MNEIDNRFYPHDLNTSQAEAIAGVRDAFADMAHLVNKRVPDGREKAIVLTHLEEAAFMAVAGIARRQ